MLLKHLSYRLFYQLLLFLEGILPVTIKFKNKPTNSLVYRYIGTGLEELPLINRLILSVDCYAEIAENQIDRVGD